MIFQQIYAVIAILPAPVYGRPGQIFDTWSELNRVFHGRYMVLLLPRRFQWSDNRIWWECWPTEVCFVKLRQIDLQIAEPKFDWISHSMSVLSVQRSGIQRIGGMLFLNTEH